MARKAQRGDTPVDLTSTNDGVVAFPPETTLEKIIDSACLNLQGIKNEPVKLPESWGDEIRGIIREELQNARVVTASVIDPERMQLSTERIATRDTKPNAL